MTQCWIVFCPEKRHPGLWARWRDLKCVAVGWGTRKYSEGPSKDDGWGMALSCLERMERGHVVVPYLGNFRLGIPGRIKAFHVEDHEWRPTTTSKSRPKGDLGRRIEVEWRKEGMPSPDKFVRIPKTARHGPVTRPTLRSLNPEHYEDLLGYILNSANWIDYPERRRP